MNNNLKNYWKVPGRDMYCETFWLWVKAVLRCHLLLRLFAPALPSLPAILFFGIFLGAMVTPAYAVEQFHPFYLIGATNLYSVSNTTATATSSTNYSLLPVSGSLRLEASYACTNVGTSNLILGFNTSSVDSNSFTTTLPISVTFTNNGSNTVIASALIDRTNFTGVQQIRWDSTSTTQTNTARINWVRGCFVF